MGDLASGELSDGSWTDEPSFLFEPLSTRSGAVPVRSIIKRSMTKKRIDNPSSQVGMQCMRGQDGKYYYIPIDPYNPAHLEIIEELSPLLVNPRPSDFQKGALYTFILASVITKDPGTGADVILAPPKLYVCQAQNSFESGTKHHHIFSRMARTNELANLARANRIDVNKVEYGLYASGEIKCIMPTMLKFNYFSGTYKMQRKIPKNRTSTEILFMKKLMHYIDPNYVIRFDPKPFITSESVPITQKHLDFLNEKGIPTFPFNEREQCRNMYYYVLRVKNMDKRIATLEEMTTKYEQMMNPPPPPPTTNAGIMTSDELKEYASKHGVPVPDPYDKYEMRRKVQEHMDANKGKGGGKQRTLKKKRTFKKRI